jgi:hypothetical protein
VRSVAVNQARPDSLAPLSHHSFDDDHHLPQFDFVAILLATPASAMGMIDFDLDPPARILTQSSGGCASTVGQVEAIPK